MVEAEGRALDAGLPGRQGRLLFAYLVLNRDRGCPRDELIDVLWPEGPPAAADSALSALLSKLRRALGEGVLLAAAASCGCGSRATCGRHRGFAPARSSTAEAALEAGDPALAADRARDALATDLQTFLPDADGGWAAEQRRELDTIRLRALETLAEAGLRQGGRELGAAEQAARAAIAAAPFRESAHRLLMEVHEAAGNPAEALRAFEELRLLLREELGTTPGPAAMAVFERVLRGEPPPARRAPRSRRRRVSMGLEPAPWPAPLAGAVDRHALVGRGVELSYLGALLARGGGRAARARAAGRRRGHRQDARCAAELSSRAHEDGAVVLYGRFDEETLTPYQPIVEMLRGWSAGAPLDALRERLGARAAELGDPAAGVRPAAADHRPGALPAPRPTPSASASSTPWPRWWARSAPRRRSCSCSTTCTGPTGRRCSCCATSCARPRRARALFVGTYRESEISDRHPLHELIGDLRREGTLRRLELDRPRPSRRWPSWWPSSASAPASESFVRALHGETEGNPFFIEEVVRHIRDTSGALSEEVDARAGRRARGRARGHRAAAAAAVRAHARRAAGGDA